MPANRKLRIFRIKDGVRIPYVLELDHELTVISEYADAEVSRHVAEGRSERLRRADSATNRLRTIMARWFSEHVEENPLPGTDPYREDYWHELAELKAKFEAKKQKCPGCEISKLQQRYREKLRQAGLLDLSNASAP